MDNKEYRYRSSAIAGGVADNIGIIRVLVLCPVVYNIKLYLAIIKKSENILKNMPLCKRAQL